MAKDKVILGIDPGTTIMGYGVIQVTGKRMSTLTYGIMQLSKLDDHALRLHRIFKRVTQLIDEHHPDELAIEAQFFGKNVQSMLKLGRAQGVAIAAALHRDIPYVEYAPKRIKQSITGNGNATKEQVAAMLQTLLNMPELPKFLDATDGLATAVCHHFSTGQGSAAMGSEATSWKAFLSKNPGRAGKL